MPESSADFKESTPRRTEQQQQDQDQELDSHPEKPDGQSQKSQPHQRPSDAQSAELVESQQSQSTEKQASAQGDAVKPEQQENKPQVSRVTDQQWRSMTDVVMAIYNHREPDGYDPSRLFHKSVNKRNVPDYYEIIKEPMALSILKAKIKGRQYMDFAEFVRDCALISHNAQTYNRPKSQAYEDALIIKQVFEYEFSQLVEQGIITAADAEPPDLGEIPEPDPLPFEEEDDEDEEDDDDDDDDDSDDGTRHKKRRRGKKGGSAKDASDADRKRRGRPPRVDTPMEARIKAVLKALRKYKDTHGNLKILPFERLPDKAAYPDYYLEIREPMAIDMIKRKCKRKKYASIERFLADIDLMFHNARIYNAPDSAIYKHAIELQHEAHKLADQEQLKPDTDYLLEDGRVPLQNGILYKGEIWKVGDWVHIQNPNDNNKPIVGQIYRTWQDLEGQQWINACWYYRPEQTVHRFDKHFYPNEVMKTGQYRDHRVEEIVDRCFVMFFTRYNRGRPRGFPPDKQVYVCEARYNEEKHKLNKIKTWASCLPDEVRELDYEMDLFEVPQRIRKVPSPIKHLLKAGAKETDAIPKPTWGADNAPPVVGAVHCKPRDETDSPPPESYSSPVPLQPSQAPTTVTTAIRQASVPRPPTRQNIDNQGDVRMSNSPMPIHSISPLPKTNQQAAIPATPNSTHRIVQPLASQNTPVPAYSPNYAPRAGAHPRQIPQQSYQQQTSIQHSPYTAQAAYQTYQSSSRMQPAAIPPAPYNPNAPRPVEVYTLPDDVNDAIGKNLREQFQCDQEGRLLFFSAPPLDPVGPSDCDLSHSAKYLAAREERDKEIKRKRKDGYRAENRVKTRVVDPGTMDSALSSLTHHLEAANQTVFRSLGWRVPPQQTVDYGTLDTLDAPVARKEQQGLFGNPNIVPHREILDFNSSPYFLANSSGVVKLEISDGSHAKSTPAYHSIGRLGMKSW
ncbi:hypothetical protein KEM54_006089 [Ascosphaera aggregata]|nr:hypothetical protein KEM54_006089 [Ascosphaera aggregata]